MSAFKRIFRRGHLYSDLSREIQEHLEEKTEELMAGGMSREDAITMARRAFGNTLLLEERSREVWRWPTLENVIADLRYAVRQLRKAPGFTTVCVLTLALGIGANAAVFSFVDALFFRPLPYSQPELLAALVAHKSGATRAGQAFSEDDNSHDGETWELVRDSVPAVQAAAYDGTTGVNLQTDKTVRYVEQQKVSAHYFEVLGIHPIIGRSFTEEEDRPSGPRVALLSYALWKSAFTLDPQIFGQTILLKGAPHTVVGVLPANSQTPQSADVWTPLQPSRSGEGSGNNYSIILRLHEGTTWQQVDAQLRPLHPSYLIDFTRGQKNGEVWLQALPLQQDLARPARLPTIILMSAVGFILLIACANLAGLMLVRVLRRRPEMATRLALGATGAAILRQVMMEPLLLVLTGAGAGLIVAVGILDFLCKLLAPEMLPVGGANLDLRVMGFAVAVSFCTALMIGILPALEASRVDLRTSMGANSGRSVGEAGGRRTRQFLIAAEVTLTVVLLSTAGLLIRTLVHLKTLPPGFDPSNVMTARVSLDDARYHDAAAFQKLLNTSVAAMHRIPGVESAAVGLSLPYERGLNNGILVADGAQAGTGWASSAVYVTPEYFQTLRIPVLMGRAFTENDTSGSERVAIVNVSFARQYLGGEDAVQRHLKTSKAGPTLTVVGLVADVAKRPGLEQTAPLASEPTYYLPGAQTDQNMANIAHTWFQPSWIVRTRGPVSSLAGAMQKALEEAAPALTFAGFHNMRDLENKALEHQRTEVILLAVLAGLALMLSLIGVYGLVSNLVTQRTREIGIRMALGSTLQRTIVEIGKAGILAAGWGIAAGLGLALFTVRIIRTELYGVRPHDPVTFGAILILLLAAVLVASLAPTARIARIDPASVLRSE
ncbi:MAG TPA: ABC transporter permease [Candidatus Angelobacter sp.]|nr:ABC transporter permease [Candidatus Angelobacter sp.]